MSLPARLPRDVSGRDKRVRSDAHRAWVRQHRCCVPECEGMPIEAAHVRSGTDGGTGMKPGDDWTISLCQAHHRDQHQRGEAAFERAHGIDMKALAREFASKSPHRDKLRRKG